MRLSKGKIVFGYRDSFSTYESLSPVIVAALKNHLEVIKKSDIAGYPGVMYEEMGLPDGQWNDVTEEQQEQAMDLWHSYIESMIWSFEQTATCSEYPHYEFDIDVPISKMQEKDRQDFIEHRNTIVVAYNNKVQYGLDLFARFYQNLWW